MAGPRHPLLPANESAPHHPRCGALFTVCGKAAVRSTGREPAVPLTGGGGWRPTCPAHPLAAYAFQRRRRRAFVTTHTELKLMAAAAIMGFKLKPAQANTPAATGMQMAL